MSALSSPQKIIVGMIHVGALPGTPRCRESIEESAARAAEEARIYAAEGFDALMIENMHDAPFLKGGVGPEIVAGMTAVGVAVRSAAPLPLGVQVLAAANHEALAVALAVGADFIRAENFAFAHVADEGLMPTAEAGPLLRYRKQIDAEQVRIIADVKKKHSSHALTADISLADAARAAEFFGADALVVTGPATAEPAAVADVQCVKQAVKLSIWIGSGVTPDNLPELWPRADAFIVGSSCKRDGLWSNEVEPERVRRLMRAVEQLRSGG